MLLAGFDNRSSSCSLTSTSVDFLCAHFQLPNVLPKDQRTIGGSLFDSVYA